jgi:hypothetical protein
MKRQKPLQALPLGIRLADYFWSPDKAEREVNLAAQRRRAALAKLAKLEVEWKVQDELRLRRRAAELAVVVAADKEWLAREQAWEEQLQKIQDYYRSEAQREAAEERKRLLAKLDKVTRQMNKSDVRAERQELLRRGVFRGR